MSFKKRYKVAYIALATLAAVSLTACGSSTRQKDQAAYRQYGINCLTEGKYEDAVGAFQLALGQSRGKIGEMELDICFYKAEAQYLAGYREDAEETYTAVINYNEDPNAYYLRGNLYFQMGRTEEGLADFAAAVAEDAKDYELYIGIYETLAANDMEAEGQEYLNTALSIRGEKAYDKMEKGRIYLLLGDTENALSYLQEALEKGEETANFYLAEAYEATGDSAQADTYFQAYLDCGIADSSELCQMGESQMEQGDATRALEYFAAALELDSVPNKQNIIKDMVIAYESLGDFSSAKSTMKDYLKLYPDDETAQREMTFLETR
jgi:tetratricopeptide (TPR) repeat protein